MLGATQAAGRAAGRGQGSDEGATKLRLLRGLRPKPQLGITILHAASWKAAADGDHAREAPDGADGDEHEHDAEGDGLVAVQPGHEELEDLVKNRGHGQRQAQADGPHEIRADPQAGIQRHEARPHALRQGRQPRLLDHSQPRDGGDDGCGRGKQSKASRAPIQVNQQSDETKVQRRSTVLL